MIDHVKVRTRQPGFAARLLADARLTFAGHYNKDNHQTGHRATFHALTYYVYPSGFVEVTGSLHKCWNALNGRGAVNYNDFRRLDLFDTLDWLQTEIGLPLDAATLHNVEFGVNVRLPGHQSGRDVLSRLLFYGPGRAFSEQAVERGYYKRADLTDFYVKAYDKGEQYQLDAGPSAGPLLRFEKGVECMKELNRPNRPPLLRTLADLNRPATLDTLGGLLLDCFDKCFWAEVGDVANHGPAALTDAERAVVAHAHAPDHWAALTRAGRLKLRGRYQRIAERRGAGVALSLRAAIVSKWAELLEGAGPTAPAYRLGNVLRRGAECRGVTFYAFREPSKTLPLSQSNTTSPPRPTATELRQNPDLLAEVERGRKHYRNGSKEPRHKRAAHHLRNDGSNPRNNLRRSLLRAVAATSLFDPAEVVRIPPDKQHLLDHWQGTRWEVGL